MSQPFGISCRGGLNTNLNQLEMLSQPGFAITLQNFEVDSDGGYRRLSGFLPFGGDNATRPAGDTPILGVIQYGEGAVVCAGDAVYYTDDGVSWIQVNYDTTETGVLESGLSALTELPRTGQGQAQFAIMRAADGHTDNPFGSLSIATGTNKLAHFHIDGTGASRKFVYVELSIPTAAKLVEVHDKHLCVVDTENAASTVYYSATRSDTDFVGTGSGSIAIADRIVGIKSFRDDLFIFCENTIHRLVNINDSASIAVVQVTNNVGCLDGNSIQEIGGDLLFLSPDGIRTVAGTARIGDVELSSVSRQIQTVINDLAENIDQFTISSAVIRGQSQYRLFYSKPSDSSAESKGIIGTLTGNGFEWSTTLGIQAPAFGSGFNAQGVEQILHGDNAGYVYTHNVGTAFYSSGNPRNILAIYETPYFDFGDIGTRKTLKYVRISVSPEGDVRPTLRLRFDYQALNIVQPADYVLENIPSPAIFGDSEFGVTVFGSAQDPMIRQTVEGSGSTCNFRITSNDQLASYAINGLYIDYMPSGRR